MARRGICNICVTLFVCLRRFVYADHHTPVSKWLALYWGAFPCRDDIAINCHPRTPVRSLTLPKILSCWTCNSETNIRFKIFSRGRDVNVKSSLLDRNLMLVVLIREDYSRGIKRPWKPLALYFYNTIGRSMELWCLFILYEMWVDYIIYWSQLKPYLLERSTLNRLNDDLMIA